MYALDKAAAITRAIEVVDQQLEVGTQQALDLVALRAELLKLRTECEMAAGLVIEEGGVIPE